MNRCGKIEGDQRNERRIVMEEYINPSVMLDSWGIEQQRIRFKNRSSIDPPGVEEILRRHELSQSIHQVSRRCRDCVKKKAWEARQIARYRGGVEPAFQNNFSRCEKHRYECNPTYNSTNDSINTKISQNSLSIQKILSIKISKTHTHTPNKSNQFYISKTSQDSLVSIH